MNRIPLPIQQFVTVHQDKLWWLHSAYSLALGVGVMWLGARDFTYIRFITVPLAAIWVSGLLLPWVVSHPRLGPVWGGRLRLAVNYLNRNYYQQILFFLLPLYAASVTPWSRNMVFVGVLGTSAVLSTLDIVYDRWLSVHWMAFSLFFAFNLFATVNLMLPILWKVGNTAAMYWSAAVALAGFASFCLRLSGLAWKQRRQLLLAAALLLLGLVEAGRPWIPPAPMRLLRTEFGRGIVANKLRIVSPVEGLRAGWSGRLYALAAIEAPQGLEERVCHRWYLDGAPVYFSPFFHITGGRRRGFRLWTSAAFRDVPPDGVVRLDVVTEGGQLIGRSTLKTSSTP